MKHIITLIILVFLCLNVKAQTLEECNPGAEKIVYWADHGDYIKIKAVLHCNFNVENLKVFGGIPFVVIKPNRAIIIMKSNLIGVIQLRGELQMKIDSKFDCDREAFRNERYTHEFCFKVGAQVIPETPKKSNKD